MDLKQKQQKIIERTLREEIRMLKAQKNEFRAKLSNILSIMQDTKEGWELEQTKAEQYYSEAVALFGEVRPVKRVKEVRKIEMNSGEFDKLFSTLYDKRWDISDNPNMTLKLHRFRKRPLFGDIVKVYHNDGEIFGKVITTFYSVTFLSNGNVTAYEKIRAKLLPEKYDVNDCEFFVEENRVNFVEN